MAGRPPDPFLERVRSLLDLPASPRTLRELEQAMADACARALSIESERLQLERRLRAEAGAAGTAGHGGSAELSRIARLLSAVEGDLAALRGVIHSLRRRQRAVQTG